MATSAFKSTTKRTPIGASSNNDDSGSSTRSGAHRRSRSLSLFSRGPPEPECSDGGLAPKGRFVNTVRGSGFPEISLDDLAIEFFSEERENESGRSSRRGLKASSSDAACASQRRGRSVSRQSSQVRDGKSGVYNNSGGGRVASDYNSRRRRSVSVVRCQISDSESDIDHSQNSANLSNRKISHYGDRQMPSLQKPTSLNHPRVLGRTLSQKDLSKLHDGYSSPSSALTDDEARDACSSKSGIEKTIRAVYAQKKAVHPPISDDVNSGLYEAMRKELRHAVEEIRMELEHAMGKRKTSVQVGDDCLLSKNSDVLQAVSTIRRNYAAKLEQSEKRKHDLLAEILLEEERGKELSMIVRELLPDSKNATVVEKPQRPRKKSNDRSRMSKRLTEEAEKYFEDFILNVEDTDISSFDGERSDGSSTLGGTVKPRETAAHSGEIEAFRSPSISNSRPVEMDGVVLPWLQWETSNDGSPLSSKYKTRAPVTPKSLFLDAAEETTPVQDGSNYSVSSRGSWSPGLDSSSVDTRKGTRSKLGEHKSNQSDSILGGNRRLRYDMEEYQNLQNSEELLLETLRQRQRINTGGLLLCNKIFL